MVEIKVANFKTYIENVGNTSTLYIKAVLIIYFYSAIKFPVI